MIGDRTSPYYDDGDEWTRRAYRSAIGKNIASIVLLVDDSRLSADELAFTFTDGSSLTLYDDGQSCCEQRYMTTDDDLSYHVGATLISIEIRDGPDGPEESAIESHNCQFLLITTSNGHAIITNHNRHNGYYGGFTIKALRSVNSSYVDSHKGDS
jgi:hypothetical protein